MGLGFRCAISGSNRLQGVISEKDNVLSTRKVQLCPQMQNIFKQLAAAL